MITTKNCNGCLAAVPPEDCFSYRLMKKYKSICPCCDCLIKPICRRYCEVVYDWRESIIQYRRA